jgi:hypothetical protein
MRRRELLKAIGATLVLPTVAPVAACSPEKHDKRQISYKGFHFKVHEDQQGHISWTPYSYLYGYGVSLTCAEGFIRWLKVSDRLFFIDKAGVWEVLVYKEPRGEWSLEYQTDDEYAAKAIYHYPNIKFAYRLPSTVCQGDSSG